MINPEDSMTTNTSNTSTVDYRLLLAKYIDHVGREEGTTFIGRCSAPEFTEAEVLALLAAEHVSATPERTGIESRKGIIEAVGAVVKSRGSYSAMGNLYRFINTWRDEQIATPAPARELTDSDIERIRLQVMDSAPVCEFAEYFARAIAAHITGTAGGSA